MQDERTLIILKPEAIRHGLEMELCHIWYRKGYELIKSQHGTMSKEQMEAHYQEHVDKPHFDAMIKRMTSGPCRVMIMQGPGVIKWSRAVLGATDPAKAEPWTIRGMYATRMEENLVHASDSPEAAAREIALWFPLK